MVVAMLGLWLPLAHAQDEGTGEPVVTGDPPLPSVDDVMDRLNDLWRSDSSHSTLSMTVVTESYSRTLELESWTRGEDEALIIIRSPAREAGTATLRTDEGLWNYAPRADRLMRIPSGLLSESWMGSHFTNDDLMRESSYEDDFDTTLAWVVEDGIRYLQATSIPHPDTAIVYTQIQFWMEAEGWLPVRADYYDGADIVRTMTFSNVQDLGGRPIPMTMELIPRDREGESTRMEYHSLELDAPVEDEIFTQRGLRRAAQRE
jgi:hypothetical protein